MMNVIEPLSIVTLPDLQRLITGYISNAKYRLRKDENDGHFALALDLLPLSQPYHKRYDPVNEETLAHYQQLTQHGCSFGAYEDDRLVGMALAEPHTWNRTLWVWEFHVAQTHRRQGIGGKLIAALVKKGQEAGLRIIVCETQTTNVPAIRFYQRMGFQIEGIDISYYTNEDFPDGEIAIFLKRRL